MKENLLIVFPTEKQVEYLYQLRKELNEVIIIEQNPYSKDFCCENIRIYSKNDNVRFLQTFYDLKVLCCHEEAIYWCAKNGGENWNYQFSKNYLSMLNKVSFKTYLKEESVLTSNFFTKIDKSFCYPVVAKPSFGFGSIGVCQISNAKDAQNYTNQFEELIFNSSIKKYQDYYFKQENNRVVFEEKIVGDFYRIPFAITKDNKKLIFPIKGLMNTKRSNSDFHWSDFEYSMPEKNFLYELDVVFEKLKCIFSLQAGVYVAEVIKNNDGVYLLEFSPRQTSERLSKMIKLATGFDMEQASVNLFLGIDSELSSKNKTVRMCIEKGNFTALPLNEYRLIYQQKEVSVYNEDIVSSYYEKLEV